MMDTDLLSILCCPETRQPLAPAGRELVDRINRDIAAGTVRNRAGRVVDLPVESALVREDGRAAYPVRDGIPQMLVDEAIPLNQ